MLSFSDVQENHPRQNPWLSQSTTSTCWGVDRLDQRMSYYQFVRKSLRWWRKVFFWMLEVVVVNSYILYTNNTDARRKLSHKEFRRELVVHLCEELRSAISSHNPQPPQDLTVERLRGSHFAEMGSVCRDCRMCSARGGGQRHLTRSFCATCSDHPHLCIGECFRNYHTRANI